MTKTKIALCIFFAPVVFFTAYSAVSAPPLPLTQPAPAAVLNAEEAFAAAEEARMVSTTRFLAVEGAKRIRKNLNDPSSFQIVEMHVVDDKKYCYTYRAKNSFNATILKQYVIAPGVASEDNKTYDKHCSGTVSARVFTRVIEREMKRAENL